LYNNLQLSLKYLRYYLRASNGKGHGMHSPFVFDFIQSVLNNNHGYQPPAEIETLRSDLKKDETKLAVTDLGAGSRSSTMKERTVRDIVSRAVKPEKFGKMLFRLAAHYKPATIVELGTSLGITTSYLSFGAPEATVYTLEGVPPIAALASWHFQKLQRNNITQIRGNFDEELPKLLSKLDSVDLAFIDGNHRYEPTRRYFQEILEKASNNSILIFDDIHWSKEMEQVWKEIRQHPRVRCSVDLFFMGFVFFREEFKTVHHHTIRF
jgi:predicted O-methyltransferase YrrM